MRFFSIFLLCLCASGQSVVDVVSAASYEVTVAPDSIAAAFGQLLADTIAVGEPGPDGRLPLELGGTTVEVDGARAELVAVSPSQVNFIVPAEAATGTQSIVIRSGGGPVSQGVVSIASVAPAVFSLDASGSGPGAILNGVTFEGEPFVVVTPENGDDDRTRLAVFATGLRNAGEVKAFVGSQELIVEYAGPAPGYPGLDQVNAILPAELDGAGERPLALTADEEDSNETTFFVDLLPADLIGPARLELERDSVNAGGSMRAQLFLNVPARDAAIEVRLEVDRAGVEIPSRVVVPPDQLAGEFSIQTSNLAAGQTVQVSASLGERRVTASFSVLGGDVAFLDRVDIVPATVVGGEQATGRVVLDKAAEILGTRVQLSSDTDTVEVPAFVDFNSGQRTAEFAISTRVAPEARTARITAALRGGTAFAELAVMAPLELTLEPDSVVGGNDLTGQVTLAQPASTFGAQIFLARSSPTINLPAFLNIAPGQRSASFAISTFPVSSVEVASVEATYNGITVSRTLTIRRAGEAALSSLAINPSSVSGGQTARGTVTLTENAPAGGVFVSLGSDNLQARVPAFLTIPAGESSRQFDISTSPTFSSVVVTITAAVGDQSVEAVLRIN